MTNVIKQIYNYVHMFWTMLIVLFYPEVIMKFVVIFPYVYRNSFWFEKQMHGSLIINIHCSMIEFILIPVYICKFNTIFHNYLKTVILFIYFYSVSSTSIYVTFVHFWLFTNKTVSNNISSVVVARQWLIWLRKSLA